MCHKFKEMLKFNIYLVNGSMFSTKHQVIRSEPCGLLSQGSQTVCHILNVIRPR